MGKECVKNPQERLRGRLKKRAQRESRVPPVARDSCYALFSCLPSLAWNAKNKMYSAVYEVPLALSLSYYVPKKDWKKCANIRWKKNSKLTVFIINMGVQKVPRLNGYMKVIWKALTHGTTIWRKDLEISIKTASSKLWSDVHSYDPWPPLHRNTDGVFMYPLSPHKKMLTMSCTGKQSVLPPFEFAP